jgi:hypothetical protein
VSGCDDAVHRLGTKACSIQSVRVEQRGETNTVSAQEKAPPAGTGGAAQQYAQRDRGETGEHHSGLTGKNEDQSWQQTIAGASLLLPVQLSTQ